MNEYRVLTVIASTNPKYLCLGKLQLEASVFASLVKWYCMKGNLHRFCIKQKTAATAGFRTETRLSSISLRTVTGLEEVVQVCEEEAFCCIRLVWYKKGDG